MSSIKLEEGKFYRTRDGRKVGPLKRVASRFVEKHNDRRIWSIYGATHGDMHIGDETIAAEWTDAPTGPVRMVTRREVVPGTYGTVQVDRREIVSMLATDARDLRAAIATLTKIADALDDSAAVKGGA